MHDSSRQEAKEQLKDEWHICMQLQFARYAPVFETSLVFSSAFT